MPLCARSYADERMRSGESGRLRNVVSTMLGKSVALGVGTAWVASLCAACGGTSARAQVPDVSGKQAQVALVHLRDSGYEHFNWSGRWSTEPVGVVLATRPAAGTPAPRGVRVRLIMSQGPHTHPVRPAMVPGIGTCDVDPPPPGPPQPCAGGPVMLPFNR